MTIFKGAPRGSRMKPSKWFSKWLILPVVLVLMGMALVVGYTMSSFNDVETSNDSSMSAWTSTRSTQTLQADFNDGVLGDVDISTSPGDVLLPPVTTTSFSPSGDTGNWANPTYAYTSNNQYATFTPVTTSSTKSPTANTGSAWTNPANAYADGTSYATITSGTPSGSNVWGTYGFSLTGNAITRVRVRYDAWSAGYSGPINTSNYRPSGNDANTGGFTYSSGSLYASAGDASDTTYVTGVTDAGGYCTFTYPAFSIPTGSTSISLNVVFRFRSATVQNANNGDARIKVGGTYYASSTSIPNKSNGAILAITNTWPSNPKSASSWTVAEINGTDGTNPLQAFGVGGTDFNPDVNFYDVWAYVTYTPPVEYDDQIRVDVSWNGGTNWSSTQNTALTSSETTTWYDVTSATTWDAAKLNDTNFKVRALAYTQGIGAEVVRLDWLPVEVTYSDLSTWSHTYTNYGIDLPGYLISTVEVGIEAYAASSEKIEIEVTWDGGTSWSSRQTSSSLGSSDPDTTTWFDFSSATSWIPTYLNNTNFQVMIWYYGSGGQVSLDYLPVRVAGRVSSGTIASPVLDTTVTGSSWDGLAWDNTLPSGTSITFKVRASDTPFLKTDSSPDWTSVGSGSPPSSTLTSSPTGNTGSAWTNPANADADGASYATITSGTPSGSNVWGTYGFDLTGQSITQVRVRYDAWHGTLGSSPSWVSPTSNTANGWVNPTYAYNSNTGDWAIISVPGSSTSAYLELYISAITCDKVRVWSGRSGTRISIIDVDVYYNSQWNNIYSGSLTVGSYQEYTIGSTQLVSGIRIRYTSSGNPTQDAYICEAQFNTLVTNSAPQIKIDVSWNGGAIWSSTQNTTLTSSETTTWYDVTSATTWDATKLNNTNFKVRALAQTVNGAVEVRLDWLPVEVTYYSPGSMVAINITNAGRYKQWQATLTTDAIANTPTLQEVRVYYYGG